MIHEEEGKEGDEFPMERLTGIVGGDHTHLCPTLIHLVLHDSDAYADVRGEAEGERGDSSPGRWTQNDGTLLCATYRLCASGIYTAVGYYIVHVHTYNVCAHTHTHTHAHTCTHTHTRMHAHTHTHTHTEMDVQVDVIEESV